MRIPQPGASHRTLPILDVSNDSLLKLRKRRLRWFYLRRLWMRRLLLLGLADGPELPWARVQGPSVGGHVRFQVEDVAAVAPRRGIARSAHLCHCDQKRPNLIIT